MFGLEMTPVISSGFTTHLNLTLSHVSGEGSTVIQLQRTECVEKWSLQLAGGALLSNLLLLLKADSASV